MLKVRGYEFNQYWCKLAKTPDVFGLSPSYVGWVIDMFMGAFTRNINIPGSPDPYVKFGRKNSSIKDEVKVAW